MILNTEIWNNLHDIFNSLAHHPQFCATVYEVLYLLINILQRQSIDMLQTLVGPSQHGHQHLCGRLWNTTDSTDKIHLSTGGRLVALVCGAEWPIVILVTACKQFPVHRWPCSWSVGSTSIPSVRRAHLLGLRDAYSRSTQPDDSLAGDARLFKTEYSCAGSSTDRRVTSHYIKPVYISCL